MIILIILVDLFNSRFIVEGHFFLKFFDYIIIFNLLIKFSKKL